MLLVDTVDRPYMSSDFPVHESVVWGEVNMKAPKLGNSTPLAIVDDDCYVSLSQLSFRIR